MYTPLEEIIPRFLLELVLVSLFFALYFSKESFTELFGCEHVHFCIRCSNFLPNYFGWIHSLKKEEIERGKGEGDTAKLHTRSMLYHKVAKIGLSKEKYL